MADIELPWMDAETGAFIRYWFAPQQRRALSRLAAALDACPSLSDGSVEANALRIAISRLIITKDRGASLARDVSHSRPHRVTETNDFDVFHELRLSARRVRERLAEVEHGRHPTVRLGDARVMPWIRDASVDMIMTSPPYLNAIDYMRGHRMSLVWFGYSLEALRRIRSDSIGAERGPDREAGEDIAKIRRALGRIQRLPSRFQNMVDRYCLDLLSLMKQSARVLKEDGRAIFVIGNSCLTDIYISNSRGLEIAGRAAGLVLTGETERELPANQRYLPIDTKSALSKRMRTESVLTFKLRKKKAA
jgi:hypothetical protein